MMRIAVLDASSTPLTWPTAGMPSARATMATWLVRAALLQHEAAQLLAVVVEQLGRAHGARDDDGVLRQAAAAAPVPTRPISTRSRRLARSSKSCSRSRIYGSVMRSMRARVSLCTRSTAASAVRPVADRLVACAAPSRGHGRTCGRLRARRDARRRARHRRAPACRRSRRAALSIASSSRALLLASTSSAIRFGDDDARLVQHDMAEADAIGERRAGEPRRPPHGRSAPGLARPRARPTAIISASTMAVVCSASTSSSV